MKTKYIFGVGSSQYELETDDKLIAHIAMALHYKTSAPIAIYSPDNYIIDPTVVLSNNISFATQNQKKLVKCIETIKSI